MDPRVNILVVEDHDDLRDATVMALSALGYNVAGVANAEAIDDELGRFNSDILILDLNLPGEDGLSVARRMRLAMPGIGIIMVTARSHGSDIASGYANGADIYLTKPISPESLNAAIGALLRRIKAPTRSQDRFQLDLQTLELRKQDKRVNISEADAILLRALARSRDQRMETWQLLELLEKNLTEQEKKALSVQIFRLRKKLSEVGASEPTIKSIRGMGYQLCFGIEISNHFPSGI